MYLICTVPLSVLDLGRWLTHVKAIEQKLNISSIKEILLNQFMTNHQSEKVYHIPQCSNLMMVPTIFFTSLGETLC